MGFKIFITGSGIADDAQQFLRQKKCTYLVGEATDRAEDIAAKCAAFDPHGLIVRQGKINGSVMQSAANLRVICKHGVGIDNIDIGEATRLKIPVFYTPLANYESVAEHTLALIFNLARRITTETDNIRQGRFDKKNYYGCELFKKTLGIIGFGRVGQRLAGLVRPLQMNVIVYDPLRGDLPSGPSFKRIDQLDELLEQSDIISLHCPLTADTKNLINTKTIKKMKTGVLLINTARGGIIAEEDLADALQEARLGGAALDVFQEEPLPADSRLLNLSNVVLTPHIAGMSDNSYKNMGMEAVKNILDVLTGKPYNREALLNTEVMDKR